MPSRLFPSHLRGLRVATPTHLGFSRYIQTRRSRQVPDFAFAFDIDGVLLRGPHILPTAINALRLVNGENKFGMKIPYVLLTNGGGVSEEARSRKLTEMFHPIKIAPDQIIQSHTVLRQLGKEYFDKPVLILGGELDAARKVAEGYGFQKAYTTTDVLAWNPSVWPFHTLSDAERKTARKLDFSKTPISAAFVFHDPRNWALDVQVLCDVIQSDGIIGNPHTRHKSGKPVEVVFCNPDLLWQSDFPRPRLGQGAFKDAFQAVYKSLTGSHYDYVVQYGKPTYETYRFAEQVLTDRMEELYGVRKMPHVYMIGDNPESDIAGANAAGWSSVLVGTGVFQPSDQRIPPHTPTLIVDNVEQAVEYAINEHAQL